MMFLWRQKHRKNAQKEVVGSRTTFVG